jgi:hypothetical protein
MNIIGLCFTGISVQAGSSQEVSHWNCPRYLFLTGERSHLIQLNENPPQDIGSCVKHLL